MNALRGIALFLVLILAGCAQEPVKPAAPIAPPPPTEPACVAATSGSPLVGHWYVVRRLTGVVGEVQTLFTLTVDGKLKQQTRVKQGKNIRSELRETGCWSFDKSILRTQVTRSNGELVDFDDAIYTTTYQVDSVDGQKLVYRESRSGSKPLTAKKMPPGFVLN